MRVGYLLVFLFAASFGDLDFISKSRNFSIELLYQTQQASNQDVIISPYLIWSSLISMAYETFGVTRDEFLKVFSLTENRSEVVEEYRKLRASFHVRGESIIIALLNFVFYDEYLNVYSDSIRRLESDFDYIAQRLSFQEPQQAAGSALSLVRLHHVRVGTSLRTKDFEDSTMILCNYFSLDSRWLHPFNVSDTMKVYYYRDGNEVGSENMMHMKTRLRYSDVEPLHASVTELPYGRDGKYCMLLVRPHTGYDVAQVLSNLREVSLKDVFDTLQRDADEFGMREVEVKLPRHGKYSRVVLNTPLINMGLTNGFDRNFANFDNFAEDTIYIGEITHRVDIILDEFQTAVHSTTPAYPIYTKTPAKQMPVNEPFIFFIMEKTTATVLLGGSYSKIETN